MIVGTAIPYKSPTVTVRRAEDPKQAPEPAERTKATTPAQFAALMALLAGAGEKTRSDLLKQVPAADGSLLDKLLAGAESSPDEMSVAAATDAARYGMLIEGSPADTNGIVPGIPNTNGKTDATSRISQAVLARIASRKSGSVEDLLALGDRDAASAKAKLDALLASVGANDAAALAAANALAAALAASASDPATPLKSTDGLDPEFRARLDAVIQRMNDEFGADVTIVETVRGQERQDMLFAQGRTAPGDVVTWTQDSNHTSGKAADVIVDGRWDNQKGFDLLQQIAKEEGLHTLGARDPGHLELADGAPALSRTARNALAAATNAKATPQANGIARVASVATVASVASVGNANSTPDAGKALPANASIGLMAQVRSTDARSASQDSGEQHRERPAPSAAKSVGAARPAIEGTNTVEVNAAAPHRFVGPTDAIERPAAPVAAGSVQRVQDINELREQSPAAPMSQMTLEIDGPDGDTQHITVGMRGNSVDTNISTDAASADRMRARVGDLQGALEGHGLSVDSVRISSPRPNDAADQVKQVSAGERDALRLGGAGGASAGDSNLAQGQRERSTATRDWEERQAARDERKSKEQQQQQDRQRPHYQEKQ